jgi:hypothetical protein
MEESPAHCKVGTHDDEVADHVQPSLGVQMEHCRLRRQQKSRSRGIVDLLAIRKDHGHAGPGLKRGDVFEMVLIQTKGGSSPRPTLQDIARLKKVARHHKAKAVILAEWLLGRQPAFYVLKGTKWQPVKPATFYK